MRSQVIPWLRISKVTFERLHSSGLRVKSPPREAVIPLHLLMLRSLIAGLTLLTASSLCSARDLALVVNKANSVRAITSADLAKIAAGSLPAWPAGAKVTFILRDPAVPEMKVALEKIFGASADKTKEVIDSKRGYFVIVKTDAEVIRMVESLSGAVGLIDIYSITSGVNVVKVNGKLPLEPGYALHGN